MEPRVVAVLVGAHGVAHHAHLVVVVWVDGLVAVGPAGVRASGGVPRCGSDGSTGQAGGGVGNIGT